MSAWMSTSKASELLTAVQLNPEIGTNDSSFVTAVIQRAARWLTAELNLDRYPHNAQGYSLSGTSASTDLESEATNQILVAVDGSPFREIDITLAGLTSGALIATELQTQIRAVGVDAYKFVTVTFNSGDTSYEITSPTYGEKSAINVSYDDGEEDICVALKLGPVYGGTEYPGARTTNQIDDMVVELVTFWYNMVGVEGMKSFSTPGEGSYTANEIPPQVAKFIHSHRRLF